MADVFNLYLTPGTVPFATPLPGNAQSLVNLLCQYCLVTGASGVGGLNFGNTEPSPENRGMPWWRTDADNNPIGMYSWNGSAWVTTSQVTPSGPTANRPAPATGQQYLDTSINRLIIFERGAWRTVDGGPGSLAEVMAVDIATAIVMNPGWVEHSVSSGRVIGAVNGTHGIGTIAGAETVTLAINQIPSHFHEDIVLAGSENDNGDAGSLVLTASTQPLGPETISDSRTGSVGGGEAFSVLNPTFYAFRLIKQ